MTVIDTARVVLWLIAMAVIVVWSTVLYAWVEERRKRGRKRQMHANVAMRRRFDRELDEIRIILADLGLLDAEPVGNVEQHRPTPFPRSGRHAA